jgi:hypothetical protein
MRFPLFTGDAAQGFDDLDPEWLGWKAHGRARIAAGLRGDKEAPMRDVRRAASFFGVARFRVRS